MQRDLSQMSLSELKKLKTSVAKEIEKRGSQSKQAIIKQMKKLCAESGLDFSEVFAAGETKPVQAKKQTKTAKSKQPATSKKPISPKYFNQADPNITWTGRGRKPEWVVTWLEQGGDMEKLKSRPW